jgi:MoaA/NifB/PqqE/SkfB family radical SAM enzyme
MVYREEHLVKNLVRVTLRCNARCVFCNIPPESEPGFEEPDGKTLLRQVARAARQSAGGGIVLSGGEPTLRKVMLEAASTARRSGAAWVEVQTNGLLVDGKAARAMADAGVGKALVALLSRRRAVHDRLTGVRGSWSKTVRAVRALHDAGIEVILNLLMTGPTAAAHPDLVRFALEEFPFVREANFSAVSATGRCAGRPDLWPDYDVARAAVEDSIAVAGEKGVRCLNPFCGLPVCAGWERNLEVCVEAQEMKAARAARRSFGDILGLRQEGEKVHVAECFPCCYRTVCGGVWRGIAEVRGGKGLRPPLIVARKPSGALPGIPRKRKKKAGGIMVSFDAAATGNLRRLRDAVRKAVERDCQIIQVLTDGAAFAGKDAAGDIVAAGASEFLVTLRSADPRKHDALAGREGSFRSAIAGVGRLAAAGRRVFPGAQVVLAAPLLPGTAAELGAFALLCERLGIMEMLFFRAATTPSPDVISRAFSRLAPRLASAGILWYSLGLTAAYGLRRYEELAQGPVQRPRLSSTTTSTLTGLSLENREAKASPTR